MREEVERGAWERRERIRRAYEWISSYGGHGAAEITIGFHVPYTQTVYVCTYVQEVRYEKKKERERKREVRSVFISGWGLLNVARILDITG